MLKLVKQKEFDKCILIDSNCNKINNVTYEDAMNMAKNDGLDLVLVNDNPVVCKIVDYKKVIFDKQKKEKKLLKNNANLVKKVKEFSFNLSIADHDLKVKCNKIKKLLDGLYCVKIIVLKRGRYQKDKIYDLLRKIYYHIYGTDKIEEQLDIHDNDKFIFLVLNPKNR